MIANIFVLFIINSPWGPNNPMAKICSSLGLLLRPSPTLIPCFCPFQQAAKGKGFLSFLGFVYWVSYKCLIKKKLCFRKLLLQNPKTLKP